MMPLLAFMYKLLCGHVFSLLLGRYLELEWLDHIIDVCFTALVFSDYQMYDSFK